MSSGEGAPPAPWPELHAPPQGEAEQEAAGLSGAPETPRDFSCSGGGGEVVSEEDHGATLPYPSLAPVVLFCLQQSTRPRSWCLALVCSPWFERVSMLVILLNCVTLGMFQPCQDLECHSEKCSILQAFDDFIFAFFAVEMVVKMVALGVFGPRCYLGDTWNRLDLFIVMAGMLEYSLDGHNVSFSAIRTVRVLRPLRAINRVPSMRILVTLLLDTLPMLGNVLLLCFFVFFIFGIVGVQLWAGLLRNRCFLDDNVRTMYNFTQSLSPYYRPDDSDDFPFICSTNRENGMLRCSSVPPRRVGGVYCQLSADNITDHTPKEATHSGCVNWNAYYNNCRASEHNPHNGAINFDNIGYAWIAIFQVITLEGWVDIMYYVMDAHSFYNFIYFIFLIIVGSFFMINLCLVVIATQFSETKQRENQLMREQRARFRSNESTLASLTEPGSCYEEMIKYLRHLCRKLGRQVSHVYGQVRPCRRGKASSPENGTTAGVGTNRPYSSREKFDLTRHLIHHHHHQPHHLHNHRQRHCNGMDVGTLEMKALHLGGEGQVLKQTPPLPLALPHIKGLNYPTILPSALFTHSRTNPGCASRVKTPAASHSQYDRTVHRGFHDSYNKAQPGVYPDVCSSACIEGGDGLAPGELSACPICAPEGSGVTYNSDSGSDMEKQMRENPTGNCFSVCVQCVRTVLRRIVDSKYFNRGIMFAILINTLSMGVEYHEQPAELTDVLEISNIVFTSLFALEMLLKLLACGLFGYISNPYNIFDLIIVIISVWEIIGQADGGLSVLRTFRLLRVLKLVRFMPALRRQLVVLMKTMDNVATFCMLLMLFIFIFSILGMHLFGCKFTLRLENGDTVSDRKNFDSLLWAIVTVFQILTQEDWNTVLYNGMASTSPWAALYFVALMTFGNYVLFNLLVAILVEGFQAEGDASRSESEDDVLSSDFDEEDKLRELLNSGSEVKMQTLMPISNGHLEPRAAMPPHIIHTHATATPRTEVSHIDSQSRRSSNASNEHHDQRSLTSLWGSRRSSWNSLGHAPSLKRRGQSGERESLLSGEGRDSLDDDQSEEGKSSRTGSLGGVSRFESFDMPELLQVPPMTRPYVECNGRLDGSYPSTPYTPQRQPSHTQTDDDEEFEESWCLILKRVLEPYKPQWCRDHEEWSLYLFAPQNEFRLRCQKVITHKMFDHIVLVFIFLNCITIALERPDIQPYSMERVFLSVSNYIFTVIFVAEMTVKVVAMGMYVGPGSYLQSSWNVLDGLLVFVSIVDILVSLASSGGNRILGILRVLRLLRTLRPLRVISRAPGLKLVVETLITSLRPIGNIVLICCAFFIVFGILGVQLFKGKFYHCEGFDTRNITNKSECLHARYRWVRRKYNFDNLGQALMSLFVLSSKDGWVSIMYDGLDAVAVDQQPIRNHNPWMLLYFISFLLIVSFFVLNMFVGVVVENFHKCRQDQEEEEARLREEKRQRRLEKRRRKALQRPYYADYSPARLYIHTLCTNHYLDLFITVIIGINVLTMSMEHYNQPKRLEEALKYFNYGFTVIFVIESVLKLVAFGFRRFFKERWNQLDLAIVLLSVMGITLEEIDLNASLPINPTIIRIMRVLRIARVLKLLKMATGMRSLLDTVVQALPQVGNLGLLFMLLFFIYAALGVELFGKLECSEENPCEGLSRHATFENFGMAFLTLFRVSTGDNWNGIMKDTLRECKSGDRCLSYLPLVSPLYFVTFVLVAQFVLVNVVVAVLMKHLEESNKEALEEAEMEAALQLELQANRRQSNASMGGVSGLENKAVGPAPEQHEDPQNGNLLSVGKPSISRMLSLPNDSYMFYPIKSGHRPTDQPISKQQSVDWNTLAGSSLSVSSQPCEWGSLLQAPVAVPQTPSVTHLQSRPQQHPQRNSTLRMLQRQEAIKSDSVDSAHPGSRDNLLLHCSDDILHLKVPSVPLTGGSAPCTPQATPPLLPRSRTASVQTRRHVYSQRSIPSRKPALTQPTHTLTITDKHPRAHLPNTDEVDEEVQQIICSSQRRDSSQQLRRSHTLSPYVAAPSCSASQSQSSEQSEGPRGCHLRKYYSMDVHGFLTQPVGCPRRHSTHGEELQQEQSRSSCQTRGRSVSPVPRKEKMSPPCISIDPPTDSTEIQSSVSSQESSTVLRRRAPSFESALTLITLEPQDRPESPPITKSPPVQLEPHPEPHSKPCLPGRLPLPQFSFDQSDVSSLSSLSELLSDSDQSSHSFPLEAQSESAGSVGSAAARSSFRKKGLVRMGSSRDCADPDSVA
ncbi:voltage-dependent T-type calcium channel subunit alpha-1H [Astyanax mexicanus]|uniref:voltage-dependent T-type calcium channel subunit alpha-1H n=1 Tax=Astyanax mexicanus TaxID=7994 RepID=UPI0020CAB55F|nr:voltage-dependent T-type calcium channel subunit alpha-1H [Astyanax mexicanus]XP_049326078.1 voltage-dependent T-type calcium channel subunit alpha-1H [Astyanax mexicanus]